jgi:hypothetical protein
MFAVISQEIDREYTTRTRLSRFSNVSSRSEKSFFEPVFDNDRCRSVRVQSPF